ncbi:hypothetical protein RJ55_06969 [Drechmeria coniospora]|nr:hypothetical protein RJ55_06969 [Drechmeria coniospora]
MSSASGAPPPLPPPPPPPPPASMPPPPRPSAPKAPIVAPKGPEGAFRVELLVFNGHPFKDHWSYWVRSHRDHDIGVLINATGDVRSGFQFEIKRNYNVKESSRAPMERIPLQWIDSKYFDEKATFSNGVPKEDCVPVCAFEVSVHRIKVPGKTLNSVDDAARRGKRIAQRNCQT